jgi:hypothetical protein
MPSRCFHLLLPLVLVALPAQSAAQCDPAPAVQAALDALPVQSPAETDWQFHQKRLAALRTLLDHYPGDPFIQREYISFMNSPADKEKVIAEYKSRHEKNPDDPRLAALYALALIGRESADAIKLLDGALAKAPDFPAPHLALVRIYNSPNFLNKEQAITHLKAYLAACPSSLPGYEPLTRMDHRQLLLANAANLRALLRERTDTRAIAAYQTLWSIEFKAQPMSQYGALRKQVRQDLARIRALQLQDKSGWYETLAQGYKLINDQEQSDWADEERQRRFPTPWELAAMSRWNRDHRYPNADDPPAQKRAYYTDKLKQTGQWVEDRPNTTCLWGERLDAMNHLDNTSPVDILAAADREIEVAEANAGPEGPRASVYLSVAEVLAGRHLDPERVVHLAQKGLKQWEAESAQPYYDLYATKDNVEDSRFYRMVTGVRGTGILADGYLQLRQAAQAHTALVSMQARLENLKALTADKQDRKKEYSVRMASWWGLMARAAEIEHHDLDAMAYYEHALLARLDARQKPETGVRDEVAENARRLWNKLGGTQDGWQTWYGRRAEALATLAALTWEDANQPLPAFELPDIQGKTWTLASLKGKVTFLNFWASW